MVLSVLLVQSITASGPILFMRLGAKQAGQIDGIVSSGLTTLDSVTDSTKWFDTGTYLNFTQVLNVTKGAYQLSPRVMACNSILADNQTVCVLLLDTERERQIGLGTDYLFEPLGPGECIVNAGLGVVIGETLQITV